MMVGKALLASVYDNKEIQLVKISGLDSEVLDNVERIQDYGFSSVPPVNESEVIFIALGGNRDHAVAIKVDSGKYRPKANAQGVVTMYDMFDNLIKMSEGKTEHTSESIELNGNSKRFVTHAELDTALQTFNGLLEGYLALGSNSGGTIVYSDPFPVLNIASAATTTIKTGG
jgi:phage gp45-like